MLYTEEDVADYLRENDVKFVCLSFCDALGVQKNISIMTSELHRAFTTGISFDASAIRGFLRDRRIRSLPSAGSGDDGAASLAAVARARGTVLLQYLLSG